GGVDGSGWDVTSGHPERPSQLDEYLGRPLNEDGVRRCLLCHVTDHRSVIEGTGPVSSDRGIGCERCHGPGGNHLMTVQAGFPDLAIARPTLATGIRGVKLCAQCHSPRGRIVARDDPAAVRFQGTTLTWSRCFTERNDTLDCLTCHDPHRNPANDPTHYEAKCRACRSGPSSPGSLADSGRHVGPPNGSERPFCPVDSAKGCIGCHMPSVKNAIPHSVFTDHFIRIHRD